MKRKLQSYSMAFRDERMQQPIVKNSSKLKKIVAPNYNASTMRSRR